MKITRKQLKKIIEEELKEAWAEDKGGDEPPGGFRVPDSWRKKGTALEPTATQELAPDELPSTEEPSKGSLSKRLASLEAKLAEFMEVFWAWQAKQGPAMSEEKER